MKVALAFGLAVVVLSCLWQTRNEYAREFWQPAPLAEPPEDLSGRPPRKLTLRVWGDPNYRRHERRWRERFLEVVADANQILRRWFAVELEVIELRDWNRDGRRYGGEIAELRRIDPGQGVDWVVGLLGPLPAQLQGKPDQYIGQAQFFGTHFVVRSTIDPEEIQNIREWIASEDDGELRHWIAGVVIRRESATLLHELGHALGASHVTDESCFMYPSASKRRARFCDAELVVMRLGFERFAGGRKNAAACRTWVLDAYAHLEAIDWRDVDPSDRPGTAANRERFGWLAQLAVEHGQALLLAPPKERDEARAASWFKRACDYGSSDGCLQLARAYEWGVGVPIDSAAARELYGVQCRSGNQAGCDGAQRLDRLRHVLTHQGCLGATQSAEGGVGGSGGLAQSVVDEVIRLHQGGIRFCYARALATHPSLEGTVKAAFAIEATGAVSSVRIAESTFSDDDVPSCISERIRKWHFPCPVGGEAVTVSHSWTFKPAPPSH